MNEFEQFVDDHLDLTRRHFLHLGAAGAAAAIALPEYLEAAKRDPRLQKALDGIEYFTPQMEFVSVERGNPLPSKLPPDKLKAVGLTRETWRLDVVPDTQPAGRLPVVKNPLSRETGNPLTFAQLMELAKTKSVTIPKVMTCNNMASPLGMGLWEGVPLREVLWLTKPRENIRRVYYHGYHNKDPKQMFQSSLAIGRVLEDPPGMPPVILCYKLNGDWITGKRGGPVRMIVPEAYGFKSVKWLTRITLTNLHAANDTYHKANNDVDSHMKSFARFLVKPSRVKARESIPVTGLAQVGMSGVKKVQVCVIPQSTKWPKDDPYFTKAEWRDAELLAPPEKWGGDMPGGKLPATPHGFDAKTNRPKSWPMSYTLAHWAMLSPGLPAGKYDIRCRTIDSNGVAQPMPRPFRKSGRNVIQRATLTVEG